MKLNAVVAFVLVGTALCASAAAPSGKIAEFTCSGYDGASTLANFPVLVRLADDSPAGFRYADMLSSSSGDELRFQDEGGEAVPFEIERWNPSGESLVWVGLPKVSKNTVFTMSYGKAPEGSALSAAGVWSPYVGVWHMDEASGAVADATGHGLAATPNVDQASGAGVIGAARVNATGGTKSYLVVPSYDVFSVGDTFSVSGWVKATADPTGCRIFARMVHYFDDGFACTLDGFDKVSVCGKAYNTTVVADTPSMNGQWVHLAVSYAGATATIYANGVQVASGTVAKVEDNNQALTIGSVSGVGGTHFKGLLDDFRLKSGAASADWVKAEYDQGIGGFLSGEAFDEIDPDTRVALAVPELENMSVSAVTVNGVPVAAEADGTYLVRPRETVTVVFAPASGYVLSSNTMSFKVRESMTLPEEGRPVAVPVGSVRVVINELCASNDDESGFNTANGGRGIDWVELRNDGDVSVDLTGWYLYDNPGKAMSKWTKIAGSCIVPAHGYAVVWCDKDYTLWTPSEAHVAAGLSTSGEPLFLARPDGTKVCEIANFGRQVKGISWGRVGDGVAMGYFLEPTPLAANGTASRGAPTPSVAFSEPHGYKDAPFALTISCPEDPSAEIRYTLDGSSPTESSAKYTGPIQISSTTVVRAAVPQADSVLQCDSSASYLFLADILLQSEDNRPEGFPASSAQQTMIYGMLSAVVNGADRARLLNGFTNSIRTVSLVIDPELMFGATTGIYVNAAADGWERPTMVEQINPVDASDEFTVPCGIRIRGAGSRRPIIPKHAFHLVFRSRYGLSKLEHPLFGGEGADSFDRIDFRVANTSWANSVDKVADKANFTYIDEVFSRDTQRDMGQPYHRSRYYNLFINGVYWGIYQTEERMSAGYAATYCGGLESSYDVVRTSYPSYSTQTVDGEGASWASLYAIAAEGFSGEHADNYNRVRGLFPDGSRNPAYPVYLNVTNLVDYMIIAHWTADCDTPAAPDKVNNIAAFRNRVDGEGLYDGFIWNRHDTEATLGNYLGFGDVEKADSLTFGTSASPYGTPWNTLAKFGAAELNYQLLQNAEYRMVFADLVYRHVLRPDGALSADASAARYRARMEELDDAVVCEAARWGDGRTRDDWLEACGRHLSFIARRTPYLIAGYRGLGWYPSVDAPAVAASDGKRLLGGEQVDAPVTIASASSGTVYYTTDGSDPRLEGGGVSAAAKAYAAAIEVPLSGIVLSARVRSAAGEWSALERVELKGSSIPEGAFYSGEYAEGVVISEPGEYFFSNANFRAGLTLGAGTYVLNNCRGTANAASRIDAAGSVVFADEGAFTLSGTGADPLMNVCDLIVSNGTLKVEYASDTPKAKAVNVTGGFAVEGEGTVDVTVGGQQCYGIYIANKDMFCRIGAGGSFVATVEGTKCAALYGNKGSVDAEVENDSSVQGTLVGSEARLFNFAGKIKLKGGDISVTGDDTSLSNRVFKSDKSITVKRGSRISVDVRGEGSEAFSCATVFEMEGGHVEVISADDCVGAETGVLITGGKFYGLSLNNDVFDVNAGDITIAGGLVLAYTTAQEPTDDPSRTVGSFGFDVNGYNVNINGGTVAAIGGDNLKGNHFPTFAGTQNIFVDEEASASKYDGKYVSFLANGTNTTIGLPAVASTKCTVVCSVPGLAAGVLPAILPSAPGSGSIGFHEVYVSAAEAPAPFALGEPAARPLTDYNGSMVTVEFEGTVPAGANVSAKVMLGGAEYAGTVDAENGAVAFEIPSDAVTAGGTYSGTVSVTVDGAVYSKEVSLVQGTLRTEADAEWICESASDFGTTGSWSGEQVSAAAGKISVSNAVFTAAKSAPRGALVTIASTFDFRAVLGQPHDASSRAGIWVVRASDADRYAMTTADGVVTNETVSANLSSPVRVVVVLDETAHTVSYSVDGVDLGTHPLAVKATGVSKVRYLGATDVASLEGEYSYEGLDSNLARSGGAEYATVADAVASGGGQVELLWDASWNPTAAGEYTFAKNGHLLVVGGSLAYSVTDNGDGTVTVSVTGGATPEAPEAASITFSGAAVKVGVSDVQANYWYALEKTTDLTRPFVVDASTWTKGSALLAGEKELSIALEAGDRQAFYRIVVSSTAP